MALLQTNPLDASPLTFPILECIHIVGFAFSIGTIALVDFRLLDLGMRRQSPAQIYNNTWLWTLGGILVVIFSGLLLFSSDPDMYYLNWSFLLKMVFLVLAIVFNYTIHRKAASAPKLLPYAGLIACVSLLLWSAVVFGGIFIAFINPGL